MKRLLLYLLIFSFTFAAFCQEPINNTIETATEISSFPFVESNLRLDLITTPNPGGQNDCDINGFTNVYYKFQATQNQLLNLEIFNNINEPINAINNAFIIVYTAPNLDAANNDLTVLSACAFGSQTSISTQSGQFYYILVFRNDENTFTTFSLSEQQDVPVSERTALIDLYNATNGANWTNSTNWNTNAPVSTWHGINTAIINGEPHIVNITLNNNNLNGIIPNSITTFEFLSVLNLEVNQLNGPIPSDIGNLSNLTFLRLNTNNLSGSIPSSISNLNNLNYLILAVNNFTGGIPAELGTMNSLIWLILGSNPLGGNIPPGLGNLTNLQILDLRANNLSETIPSEIGNLNNLTQLFLFFNNLSGTIPNTFENLTNLNNLSLNGNNLEGSITNALTNLSNLQFLNLANNNFNGAFPDFSSNPLQLLWIQNNKFQFGDFENEFPIYQANINNFQYTPQKQLDPKPNIIAVNGQEISVSANVSGLDNNYFWSKRNNNNTSTVISNDENLSFSLDENNSGIYFLEVSSSLVPNLLLTSPDFSIGQDPTSSPDFDVLVEFYNTTNGNIWLNNANWLNPNIPLSEWFGLTVENNRVTEINLFNNGLSGEIPTSITDLTELKTLSLSGNNLAGTIPELSILPAIEFVNINNNDFSFLDFEPHFNSNISIQNYMYSFQNLRDTPIEFEPVIGNNYEFFMTDVQGTDVQYQWYKEVFQALDPFSEPVEGATSNTITFNNIQSGELSTYFCAATSSLIPDLVIRRGNVALTGPVSQQERDALIAFYNALDGDNWTNNTNWLTAAPVRDWIGVNTTGNKVTGLTLGFSGISNASGEIPEEIGDLTHLVFLDFALNSITGNLPTSFTNLTNLRRIRLQGLPMSGTLPANIGNLTKLEEILIVFSGFTGPIPSNIGNLTNLRRFDMNGNLLGGYKNNLSGELPASLGNLTNLGLLRLDQNSLEGQIPSNLSNLAADTQFGLTINLVNNNFSGPLPDWSLLPNPSSTQIFLQENLFGFGDLEPLVNNGVSYAVLNYSPQRTNDIEETIDSGEGEDITLNVNDTNLNRDIENTAMNNEYQWFKDGALITGANASSYNILNAQESDSGVYFCQITNDLLPDLIINRANITLNVDSTLTIESLNSNDFSLYPNPVSNWLTIKIGSNAEAKVTIVDINGKQLLEKEIHTNISSLNVEQLPAGVYLITINNNNASSTKRFIKQ